MELCFVSGVALAGKTNSPWMDLVPNQRRRWLVFGHWATSHFLCGYSSHSKVAFIRYLLLTSQHKDTNKGNTVSRGAVCESYVGVVCHYFGA